MADSLPQPQTLRDTPCVTCGYNLRGLSPDARCPECNTPIDWSLSRYRLCLADADWIESLRRGMHFMVWGVIAIMLVVPAIALCVLTGYRVLWIGPVLLTTAWVSGTTWGTWLLTTPEPRSPVPEERSSLRRVIRACMMLSLAGMAIGLTIDYFGGIAREVIGLVAAMLVLTRIIQDLGELVYLRHAARRVPDVDLVRSTSWVLWTVIATLGLFLLADALGAGAGALGNTALTRGADILNEAASIAVLPIGLWYTYLLIRYEKLFLACAKSAASAHSE